VWVDLFPQLWNLLTEKQQQVSYEILWIKKIWENSLQELQKLVKPWDSPNASYNEIVKLENSDP